MQNSSTDAVPVVVDMEVLLRQLHELAGRAGGQAPPQEETATAAGEEDCCAA